MSLPLVTITIPTYNSAKSLALCLQAVKGQTYGKIEVNIIDNFSSDTTVKVARQFKVRTIVQRSSSLLEARYEGVKRANGTYVLILDSDQILAPDTVERAVSLVKKNRVDMIALEEGVYRVNTIVERLFQLDRMLINKLNDLSPFTGVIMPRFFKRTLLMNAYKHIPQELLRDTGGPDHAVVYYEAWCISKRVGVLSSSVNHIEPSNLGLLMRKMYRWGYTSVAAHYGKYGYLMRQKERLRKGLFTRGLIVESIGSIILLLFKGIAFKTGYYMGVIDRFLVK